MILFRILSSLLILFIFSINPVYSARDTNSYDGNIFPIYAGNGSLVPPPSTLSESLKNKRTSVLVFYLDDSSTSKQFAPVVSGIKLLWSSSIDLIPLSIDELDNNDEKTFKDPGFYWHGKIPQVVILDGNGNILLDKEGQVSFDDINEAITKGTGLKKPDFNLTVKSFNEYNSEPSKEGYTKPRGS
ncbi:thylakoid membrane photosystem I accumulation factor [Prochlorococcus marinus]|uniref:Thioredoxin n=1 Tax=Prochlorococcus marinus XMU1408 TaxID=2213228 RepID=A0A318RAJ9_PROMR|nr:thylakoid membrane photosystem I accumulation factor [Prochlorococcus marinus]MBW3041798.1 thioredoxin [Prochlorococcus marinus str. XMU1408]PYE02939.1 thioredoxin [Prochlorococcus marinus XMU1408]